MEGGGLHFTLLTHSSKDTGYKSSYFNQTMRYCTLSESELEDCIHLDPEMSEFQGLLVKDIPIQYGVFRVGGTLFMFGGCRLEDDPIAPEPTNWLWSVSPPPPHAASPNMCWTRCPTAMNVKRYISVLVPLRDGRIFICGGTTDLESWAEIYDPVKGQFEARKLSDDIGYPMPTSCFQWTDELVVIYYHRWFYSKELFYRPSRDKLGEDKQHSKPSLLSYNLRTKEWEVIEEKLPGPLPTSDYRKKRNLVYVGCDTLFIIDSTSHWFSYNLSSKEVGKVKVEGQSKEYEDEDEELVVGAVYAGNNVSQSTGWVIYIFQDNCETCLRYSKVEVVQWKGMDYVATVLSSGLVTVGFFTNVDIIVDHEITKNEVKTNALAGKALLPKKRARESLLKEKGEEKIDDE
ncbi:uncharacterized protein LOC125203974 isoform X1 [Salvia hispanica]|uniref:uncharacterized protein LOC125203974 isoform X1 n=1 Tax=Salvia hispanica TaxID=49212 RepID=UPI002009CF30|nr:uncharacterized protein LOC125203974 isoform X1 [Salvia hispanica]